MPKSRVLSVIVNYNGGHWIVDAVGSLLRQTYAVDVLVIDNASTDGSVKELRDRYPGITIIEPGENLGFARGSNYALKYTNYDYYLLFNPDACAEPSMAADLVAIMDGHRNVAILGPTIVEYDQPAVVQAFDPRNDFLLFPFDRWEGRSINELPNVDIFDVNYACAAAVMYRADIFRELGGLDESFFMFSEEPDYSWRARLLGYLSAVTPRVHVRHFGGATATVGTRDGAYETSLRRIYLRERNTLMMAIKCYAAPTLALYLAVQAAALFIECTALLAVGKSHIAKTYYEAVRDAFRNLPDILEKRRQIQKTRCVSELTVLRTLTPGYAKFMMLLRRGVPKIKDWQRSG